MSPRTFLFAVTMMALPRLALAQDVTFSTPIYSGTGGPATLTQPAPLQGQTALSPKVAASVDPSTGAVSSSFAFQLETARGGAQPGLGLTYNSQAPNVVGFAGMGWTLSGAPSIVRKGAAGMPRFVDDVFDSGIITPGQTVGGPADPSSLFDSYMADGSLLVPICVVSVCKPGQLLPGEVMPTSLAGASVSNWMYFRREQDDGARYFFSPGGQTWIKQEKSGQVTEFGHPLDAGSVNPSLGDGIERPSASTNFLDDACGPDVIPPCQPVYRWDIVRQSDAVGNTVYYSWTDNLGGNTNGVIPTWGRQLYLSDVYDTLAVGASPAPASFAHHVHVGWQLLFNQPPDLHSPIWLVQPFAQVATVDVTSASWASTARSLVRRYSLEYLGNGQGVVPYDAGTISRLQSITLEGECGTQGNLMPVGEQAGSWIVQSSCPTPNKLLLASYAYYPEADYKTLVSQGPAFQIDPGIEGGTSWFGDLNGDGAADFIYEHVGPNTFGQFNHGSPFPIFDPTHGALNASYTVGTNRPLVAGDWLADGSLNWITETQSGDWGAYTVEASGFRHEYTVSFAQGPRNFSVGACSQPHVCDLRPIDGRRR